MCVAAAQAKIVGPEDVYVKKGSTISLTCTVNVQSTPPSSVSWHHGGDVVDFDSPRYKPRESSSRVLPVNVPSPLAPAPLFHARPRQLGGRAGGERGRQKRREKLIPFRSIASRYDYRWCALWERDASNVMHPPIASIFFHHGEKLEDPVYLEGYFIIIRASPIGWKMIFFVSRIRMETDERKNWKGLFPSSRVESRGRVSMHLATASKTSSKSAVDGCCTPLETVKFP